MARAFGSMDTMAMRDDPTSGERRSNGDPVDPILRKWSLADPEMRKLDSKYLRTRNSLDITSGHRDIETISQNHDGLGAGFEKGLTIAAHEEGPEETSVANVEVDYTSSKFRLN